MSCLNIFVRFVRQCKVSRNLRQSKAARATNNSGQDGLQGCQVGTPVSRHRRGAKTVYRSASLPVTAKAAAGIVVNAGAGPRLQECRPAITGFELGCRGAGPQLQGSSGLVASVPLPFH